MTEDTPSIPGVGERWTPEAVRERQREIVERNPEDFGPGTNPLGEYGMTDVPTRVAKVLNEMFGTCMVAEQIEPVLDRLEQEGLLIVNAGDVSMSEVTNGFDLIE